MGNKPIGFSDDDVLVVDLEETQSIIMFQTEKIFQERKLRKGMDG